MQRPEGSLCLWLEKVLRMPSSEVRQLLSNRRVLVRSREVVDSNLQVENGQPVCVRFPNSIQYFAYSDEDKRSSKRGRSPTPDRRSHKGSHSHGNHHGSHSSRSLSMETPRRSRSRSPLEPLALKRLSSVEDECFQSCASADGECCCICLDEFSKAATACRLSGCSPGHLFHFKCIDEWFSQNKMCPVCKQRYGVVVGPMPYDGARMRWSTDYRMRVPGFSCSGAIVVEWEVSSGVQGRNHPAPGMRFPGIHRQGFLPNNSEGQAVLELLKTAFERRLMFQVGRSITRNEDNLVVWNGIHVKTALYGGPPNYAYPDPTYLARVKEELAAKGVEEGQGRI